MKEFFYDETGKLSMKRVCGLLCTIALCVTMYVNSFSPADQAPSSVLVELFFDFEEDESIETVLLRVGFKRSLSVREFFVTTS